MPIQIDPLHLVLEKARLLRAAGRDEEALALLRPQVAQHPDHAGLAEATALTLLTLGRHEEALAEARRAVALKPGEDGLRVLALAASELGQKELGWDAAIEAARLGPENPANHYAVAIAYAKRWPPTSPSERRNPVMNDAIRAAEQGVRLAPDVAYSHALLAHILLDYGLGDTGYRERAQQAVDTALQLDPQSGIAQLERARLQSSKGNYGGAVDSMARSLRTDPDAEHTEQAIAKTLTRTISGPYVLQFVFPAIFLILGLRYPGFGLFLGGFAAIVVVGVGLLGLVQIRHLEPEQRRIAWAVARRNPDVLKSWAPMLMTLLDAVILLPYGLWYFNR